MADSSPAPTGNGEAITPESVARVYDVAATRIAADLRRRFNWPLAGWEVEDVLQEGLKRLLTAQRTPDRSTLEAYYYGTCLKIAYERLREAERRRTRYVGESDVVLLDQGTAPSEVTDGEQRASEELLDALYESIPQLCEKEQAVIEARLKREKSASMAELAAKLRISRAAFWQRYHRARQHLREELIRRGFSSPFD